MTGSSEETDFLWGADQIAKFLGLSKLQVYRHQDKLPIQKLGRKMVASRSGLREFLRCAADKEG